MRILFGGAATLSVGTDSLGHTAACIAMLRSLGHEAEPYKGEAEPACDLFVVFLNEMSGEQLASVQDMIEIEVPVLCLTDGRAPLCDVGFLVAADQMGMLQLTHYRDFDDLSTKLLRFLAIVGKNTAPQRPLYM